MEVQKVKLRETTTKTLLKIFIHELNVSTLAYKMDNKVSSKFDSF